MAKYRLLSLDELHALEKEFIDYLVINGITADTWINIKESDKEQAESIIDTFSDVVFESILRKIKYLEIREKHFIYTYQCNIENLVLVALETPETVDVDFTDENYVAKAMKNPPKVLSIYSKNKPYSKTRELELFDMLQSGCQMTDDRMFKALCMVLAENKSQNTF